jgi:hypothetical protein
MSTLRITYAGYAFHEAGVCHYGHSMSPEGASAAPRKLNESFSIKQRFFETTFADNEARWADLKDVLRANPSGLLTISDERGGVIENRNVHFAGIDGPEEWGQYRREITVKFAGIGGVLTIDALSAGYTPSGGAMVVLPNVGNWNGAIKTERPSTHANIRREAMESVNANGKWTADPALSLTQRRDALLTKQAEIKAAARCKDGTLDFGTFSKVMQIDQLTAEIDEGMEELNWSLSAFRRDFPDGNYAELDYEVATTDEREESVQTVTLSGRCVAHTKAAATTAVLALKSQWLSGRQFLGQELKAHALQGTDGEDDCIEMTFTFRFRALLGGSVVSYTLKVTTEYDARAGDLTTTYSGTVVASTGAAAVTQARQLGDGKEASTLFKMNSREEVTTTSVGGTALTLKCDFSYSYLGKSPIVFAEISYDTNTDYFGSNTYVVGGSCTAANQAAALAFVRAFKVTGFLERSMKETPSETVKGDVAGVKHLVRVEFSYAYAKASVRTTMSYGKETVHDFNARETSTGYTGTCWGTSVAVCNAAIDGLVSSVSGAKRTRSERRENISKDVTNSHEVLESVTFTEGFVGALTVTDTATILEAQYSIAKHYGLWVAQIDEIPYGSVYVQPAVKKTCGTITVAGSVTVVPSALGDAQSFANALKTLATGYLDVLEETPTYDYEPRSATGVRQIRFAFQYASRDPNLVA